MTPKGRPPAYSVLIVDDDPACRHDLQTIVEMAGFPTMLAADGEEALDLLQARPVHLLLCDMQMPRLSGLETVHLAHRFNSILPCILVTAQLTDRLMREALQAHVFSVVAKPVSRHELLYLLTRALRKTYETHSSPFSAS